MAVTISINKKIQRLDLVKTALSHGWKIGPIMVNNLNDMGDQIEKANIKIFNIQGMIGNDNFMLTYQPEIHELTLASSNKETEIRIKDEVTCIFVNSETGTFLLNNPDNYIGNLVDHAKYLKNDEYMELLNEAKERSENLEFYR